MEELVNPTPEFWADKRVLVTGHTGFKGAWLSLWLRSLGANVFGLSLPPKQPSLFATGGLDSIIPSTYGDIRNLDTVKEAVRRIEPEIVFHLAAQPLVRLSYQTPVETFATNIMGTVHVLAAAQDVASVRSIVVVTSDKCYQNREWLWAYREDEPMGGHDPYSSSKGCAELITTAWRKSFNGLTSQRRIGIATARAGNVIGGGGWAEDRIVPDCIRALTAGKPIGVRNPVSTRPWQHVLEPVRGYLMLAERLSADRDAYSEGWNFGPVEEDVRSVAWIAEHMVRIWGGDARCERIPSDQRYEATLLKLDASKARARLQWVPRLRLESALNWTVDWYRKVGGGGSASKLTLDQISRYTDWGVDRQ